MIANSGRFSACAMGLLLLGGCTASPFVDRTDLVAPSTACASRTFDVYFAESAATLTQPARQAIDLMARQMAACEITHVTVIGLASATGTPETNLTLSQRRAQTVAQAFEAKGWPVPAFEIEAAGDAGATNPDGTQEPLRRRTQVLIQARPR